jgi:MtN3 and saliva related transmembrane protein
MNWIETCGFLGGLLTTISMIPQLWRLFEFRKARDISLTFVVLFEAGIFFWLFYGLMLKLEAIIFWNSVAFMLGGGLIVGKLKWGKR